MYSKHSLLLIYTLLCSQVFSQNIPEQNITTKCVSNTIEFLQSIANHTEITVDTDTLDLTIAHLEKLLGEKPYQNYFSAAQKIFFSQEGLVLHGFTNLSIVGKELTNVISRNPDHIVITFENCKNITLNALTFFHTEDYCSGDVLRLLHSKGVELDAVGLNGSGAVGANIVGTDNVTLSRVAIYNNSKHAIRAYNARNIKIKNSFITHNPTRESLVHPTFSELQFLETFIAHNETETFAESEDYCISDFLPRFETTEFQNNGFTREEAKEKCSDFSENIDYGEDSGIENEKQEQHSKKHRALVSKFFEYQNQQPGVDETLSYFSRENIQFLSTQKTNQLPVFQYFFNPEYIATHYELEDIEIPSDRKLIAQFTRLEMHRSRPTDINKVTSTWSIEFDHNHRFSSVVEINKQRTETLFTGFPEFPVDLKVTEDYEFSNMFQYHIILMEDIFNCAINYLQDDFYAFHMIRLRMSDAFYNPNISLERVEWNEKENIHLFNQYLHELQLVGWKVFYDEQNSINPERAELFKTELAKLYHNIWTTSTYQYYANETLDLTLSESKYTLTYPKIPKLEDNEIAIYLNEITMEFHNYGFVRPEYEPFNFEYFEGRIDNLFSSEDNISPKDKKRIERFLKQYARVQKAIDGFLKEFHQLD